MEKRVQFTHQSLQSRAVPVWISGHTCYETVVLGSFCSVPGRCLWNVGFLGFIWETPSGECRVFVDTTEFHVIPCVMWSTRCARRLPVPCGPLYMPILGHLPVLGVGALLGGRVVCRGSWLRSLMRPSTFWVLVTMATSSLFF